MGKRKTALAFAKALNCSEGNLDSCDRCSSCLKIDHGNHPDIVTIEQEENVIKIGAIKDLQKQMRFRSVEGGTRVFIIVDADKMNGPAANCLLKTLEEPPPSNIFILTTSSPHLLPATARSRCQHLRFNPICVATVASFLEKRLSLETESAYLLASSSGGSIGRAMEMNRESYLTLRNDVIDKVPASNIIDPLKFLSSIDNFGDDGKDILKKLEILKSWYRDILLYRETGETQFLTNRDRIEQIKYLAGRVCGPDILKSIKTVDRACSAIEQNANKQLTIELMMHKLTGIQIPV